MECPSCRSGIDDDSFFCDQCGSEVLVCSECGRPGTRKRCPFDGKPLAPARERVKQASLSRRLVLTDAKNGIELTPADGDVLGRVDGPHMALLGKFSGVSSRHLQIRKSADGQWLAVDLGSFNGTHYDATRAVSAPPAAGGAVVGPPCPVCNGRKLAKDVPEILSDGATLCVAKLLHFRVSLR